ncbi:hypothetical protein SDC9_156752 [bioreactor metagenome]|uniref:Uncharacterized protein n=1 Tax=bioreactor metagenome TaxID=1076179 RepID=A0A645F7F8_9ZZZZ
MHFVLHCGKKIQTDLSRRVVVDTGCVDVGYLLIKTLLRRANLLNPLQQFVEIIKRLIGILQPLIIQNKPLADELAQMLSRPNAELGRHLGLNPVANRNNHVEVVVFQIPFHLPRSLLANCSEIPNSCLRLKFPFSKNIGNMLADISFATLEKLHNHRLRQPDGFIFKPDIQFDLPVFRLINEKLTFLQFVHFTNSRN